MDKLRSIHAHTIGILGEEFAEGDEECLLIQYCDTGKVTAIATEELLPRISLERFRESSTNSDILKLMIKLPISSIMNPGRCVHVMTTMRKEVISYARNKDGKSLHRYSGYVGIQRD